MYAVNKKVTVTVKSILSDRWNHFKSDNNIEDYQIKEVEKALSCYDTERGCFVYFCKKCKEYTFQALGCNSRLCSCCGKRYTDQWSNSLSKAMFKVPHRHIVISVPDGLWSFLSNWKNRKLYMDAAILALNQFFTKKLRKGVRVGVIVILHSFGKDMKKQPHLHLLITEGAFDKSGKFIKCKYIPANSFRKIWQYHVLKLFQENGLSNSFASKMFEMYPKGFYVWVHKQGRIRDPKLIGRYVGRYVRHPAIADSRIVRYKNGKVVFYYKNNNNEQVRVVMLVDEFISLLISHIPPPQFKTIRYYGAYSRRTKSKFAGAVQQSSIKQLNLSSFGFEKVKRCPKCGGDMVFICYQGKGPPKVANDQVSIEKFRVA